MTSHFKLCSCSWRWLAPRTLHDAQVPEQGDTVLSSLSSPSLSPDVLSQPLISTAPAISPDPLEPVSTISGDVPDSRPDRSDGHPWLTGIPDEGGHVLD